MKKIKPKKIDCGVSATYELEVEKILGYFSIKGIPLQVLMKKFRLLRKGFPNRKIKIYFGLPIQYKIDGEDEKENI